MSAEGHTGCQVPGDTSLFLHGTTDGERLISHTTYATRCDQGWDPSDIFETPVEGIVEWRWAIDLTVVSH